MPKKVNVQELLKFLNIPSHLVSGDQELQTTCPFCGKEDHYYFNTMSRVGECKVCHEGGHEARFIAAILNYVTRESETNERGQVYWQNRGIQEPREYRLGFYPALGRYTIPYRNSIGDITNIAFRSADPDAEEFKYLRLPGFSSRPYALGLSGTGPVVVVEGEVDAVSLHQCLEDVAVVGLPGGATVTDDVRAIVRDRSPILAVIHKDGGGRITRSKYQKELPQVRCLELPEGYKDVNDFVNVKGIEFVREWFTTELNKAPSEEIPGEESPKGPIIASMYVQMPDETPPWLIENLWMSRALGFLGGLPKAGKSLMALHLALAVSENKKFLGRHVATPGPVIYIQEEDPDFVIRGRLRGIVGAAGGSNLYLLTPGFTGRHFHLDDDDSMSHLSRYIDQIKPVLVIMDPLANMHNLEDENSAAKTNLLMEKLRYMRDEKGCSFMIVHHEGKPGKETPDTKSRARSGSRLRGSSVLWAKAENLVMVERRGTVVSLVITTKISPDIGFDIEYRDGQFVQA